MKQKAVKYDLNRKNDRDKLKKLGIKSPDIGEMRYSYYDAQRRITYYFRTEERYLRFKQEKGVVEIIME
ncbi:hypothetical protein ACRTDU_02760 [Sunxiuqinia elliptica]